MIKLIDILKEIKVNTPGKRLKIVRKKWDEGKLYVKDNPWYKEWEYWDEYGEEDAQKHVYLYKNYLYVTPGYDKEDEFEKYKNIFDKNGIKNQIITWHGHPYLKITSKNYEIIG